MTGWAAETVAVVVLIACLAAAVLRPRGISEGVVAVPGAVLVVALGVVPWSAARRSLADIGPTVAFLAAILVFGHLCADAGVFRYLAGRAARASDHRPARLLGLFVLVASAVTATLTLDTAVVLLTPVVVQTARALRIPARPHAFACVELANAGSLLLPVSNLTNLLAFAAADVSFGRFTALMALPWVAATVLQGIFLRRFFAGDLPADARASAPAEPAPAFALVVLVLTVAGFVITSAFGVAPAWAALGGVILLGGPALWRRSTTPRLVIRSAGIGFVAFVLALAVIVDGVVRHGLGSVLRHVLPSGTGLLELLALAAIATVLANLVNNLPATLVLVPLVAGHPLAVLAVLIGLNVGPNLTYAGSLANLLWRRLLPAEETDVAGSFHRYGALSVPPILVVTTVLLWSGAQLFGA